MAALLLIGNKCAWADWAEVLYHRGNWQTLEYSKYWLTQMQMQMRHLISDTMVIADIHHGT